MQQSQSAALKGINIFTQKKGITVGVIIGWRKKGCPVKKVWYLKYRVRQKNVYTLQGEKTLCCMLVLNLIIHHKLNTSYNRAQYKLQ